MLSIARVRVRVPVLRSLFPASVLLCLLGPAEASAQFLPPPPSPPVSQWTFEDRPLPGAPPPISNLADEEARTLPDAPAAPFGAKGQVVLGGASSVGFAETNYASTASTLTVRFSPNLDYFVLKNLSIGLDVNVGFEDDHTFSSSLPTPVETKTTSVGLGPRIGLNVPLGESMSWWLTGTLGFESAQTSTAGEASSTKAGPYISAYLPLLFHPVPHFFLGLGPSLFHEFASYQGGAASGDQGTTVGATFVVGGYTGGSPVPAPAPVAASESPKSTLGRVGRFGDRGEFLFSSDLSAYLLSTSYASTSTSTVTGGFDASVDYFFVDHVSFGGDVYATFGNTSDPSSNGVAAAGTSVDTTSYGFNLRLGAQIPLAGPLSLYPRIGIGFGGGSYTAKNATEEAAETETKLVASAFVPFVVEVAPHFVVGFGPSVTQDLTDTVTYSQGQQIGNSSTTVGASFLVGGWL